MYYYKKRYFITLRFEKQFRKQEENNTDEHPTSIIAASESHGAEDSISQVTECSNAVLEEQKLWDDCVFREKWDAIVNSRVKYATGQFICPYVKFLSDSNSDYKKPTFSIEITDSQARSICETIMIKVGGDEDEMCWKSKMKFWKTYSKTVKEEIGRQRSH